MAFLPSAALPTTRARRATRTSTKRNRGVPRALPHASAGVSPAVRDLLRQQREHPIFQPSLLAAPLSSTLEALQTSSPPAFHRPSPGSSRAEACALLADYHPRAIASARRAILVRFPGIDAPGGKLYPAFRAAACWRDLREFSRVVAYYIVAQQGFSDTGFAVMREVYKEMEVPLDAMRVGVECLRDEFVALCAQGMGEAEEEMAKVIGEGFDTLLGLLEF